MTLSFFQTFWGKMCGKVTERVREVRSGLAVDEKCRGVK